MLYKKYKLLSFVFHASLISLSLLLFGCTEDSSSTYVSIDSDVPTVMQSNQTDQGVVALLSTSVDLSSSDDSMDTRQVTISDSSSCSSKLIFSPSSLALVVDGSAKIFTITAPSGNCLHKVMFSGNGVTTSSSDLNVVQDAIVTVGLFDSGGTATTTVYPADSLYVKFSPPTNWENVTGEQSYMVSSEASGFIFSNNPCVLIAPQEFTCTVVAAVGSSVEGGEYSFNIVKSPTSVPVNETNLAFTVQTNFAFVTNAVGTTNSTVSRCDVDDDGTFSNCIDAGGSGFFNPAGIILNTAKNIAFVVENGSNDVLRCDIDGSGLFSNCTDISGPVFLGPYGIALNSAQNIAFVTNTAGINTVSRCDIDSDGIFSNCADTGGTNFSNPTGIVLNAAEDIAFIANNFSTSNTVSRCDIDSDGIFSNCIDTGGVGFSGPIGIVLNVAEDIAFVTNEDSDTVSRCDVDGNGLFTNCTDTGGTGFQTPAGIVLNSTENIAFVTNIGSNTVSRCDVDISGNFTNCSDTNGTGFDNSNGIVFNF